MGIDCFRNGDIPSGEPCPQQPLRFKNWGTVLGDIKSTFLELDPADIQWWKLYLQRLENRFETPVKRTCSYFPFHRDILPWKSLPSSTIPPTNGLPEELFADSGEDEHVYAGEYRTARQRAQECARVGDLVAVSVKPSKNDPFGFSIARILKLHTGPQYAKEKCVDKNSFNFTVEWLHLNGVKEHKNPKELNICGENCLK